MSYFYIGDEVKLPSGAIGVVEYQNFQGKTTVRVEEQSVAVDTKTLKRAYDAKEQVKQAKAAGWTWRGEPVEFPSYVYEFDTTWVVSQTYQGDQWILGLTVKDAARRLAAGITVLDDLDGVNSSEQERQAKAAYKLRLEEAKTRYTDKLNSYPQTGPVLVRFSDNWADEVDVDGWEVQSAEGWLNYAVCAYASDWPRSLYIGSNQDIEYDAAESYLACFTVESISDSDAETLQRLFGGAAGETGEIDFE